MFSLFSKAPSALAPLTNQDTTIAKPTMLSSQAPQLLDLNDVFICGGSPTVTEIDRTSSPALMKISPLLLRKGRIISWYGPSKSGKTISVRQITRGRRVVEIHGRSAMTLAAFWDAVRAELNMPRNVTRTRESAAKHSCEGKLNGSIEASLLGSKAAAEVAAAVGTSTSSGTVVHHDFGQVPNSELTEQLIASGAILVVDDAHQIPPAAQVEILRDLREFLTGNGTVVWISVPERAARALADAGDHELATLTSVVEAPQWTPEELCLIASTGFAALGLVVPRSTIRKLAHLCHLNPLLMQMVAFNFCLHFGVLGQQYPSRSITPTPEDLRAIVQRTAREHARPSYLKFATMGDKSWRLNSGQSASIYSLALLGMRHIGFAQEIGTDRLTERIGELLGPDAKKPEKGVVTRALQHLSGELADLLQHNTPLELDETTRRVYFLDCFFLMYLQYVFAPEVGEPEPVIK